MTAPVAVQGDRITGICNGHQIPGGTGNPVPAPPLPFSSPLTAGLATSVTVGGTPAAVVGSGGTCDPGHTGLHGSDPFLSGPSQRGAVVSGSSTVFFDGQPAATATSNCTMCMGPASALVTTQSTVLAG